MEKISWHDFERVELRAGTIVSAQAFPEAHVPAYKLVIDFGPDIGRKSSSAQITDLYTTQDLIGRQVIAVVNFAPKQIGPFMSECLVTGFNRDDNKVVLSSIDGPVPNGAKLA